MDDFLAKPFTLEQMKAMLTTWLGSSELPDRRERLSLATALPAPPDSIDDKVLDSLRQLQREGRRDIVQQVIGLFMATIDMETVFASGPDGTSPREF